MAKRQDHEETVRESRAASIWNHYTRHLQTNVGQIVLSAAFLFLAGLLAFFLWGRFSGRILAGKNYVVTTENIHVPTPIPSWIRTDFKAEAITDGSLEELNVHQKDLQRRVASAFEMHPWVAEVRRVTTRYPGQVIVDLTYRRPIAMVEVDNVGPNGDEQGLYPVDPTGTLLPTAGFTQEEAALYPRIVAADSTPNGTPGLSWGDIRVHGAAKIAQHLEKSWQRLQLSTIIAHPDLTGITAPSTVYEIRTHDQTTIIWGHGPGQEDPGEPRAERKVQRLLTYVNKNGTLAVEPGQIIDLRQADHLSVGKREDLDISIQ